jgi:hypothetical protein
MSTIWVTALSTIARFPGPVQTRAFPAANITSRNGCVPATPSAYMVLCLEASVSPDVDLVFVEYNVK